MRTSKLWIFIIIASIISFFALITYLTAHTTVYVSPTGSDSNPGTREKPFQHISLAYSRVGLGGTIYVLPGTYREEVSLQPSKFFRGRVTIQGLTEASQHAIIVGSEDAGNTSWTRCTDTNCPDINANARSSVFVGDWSAASYPNILTETTKSGEIRELILARSPNEFHDNPDKYHEFWWTADATNTSSNFLIDTKDDHGMQKGNLTTTPSLVGSTAYIMDGNSRCGTFLYERQIVSHNLSRGQITFSSPVGADIFGNLENGMGQYTKYYVENNSGLLDAPGEWFFDNHTHKLYIWPLEQTDPLMQSIEVGVRGVGIRINASDVHIDNITVRIINDTRYNGEENTGAVVIGSGEHTSISNISLTHLIIQNVGNGISVSPPDSTAVGSVVIGDTDISHTTKSAITATARVQTPSNINNIIITDSSVHDSGFLYNEPGIFLFRVSDARVVHNHVYADAGIGISINGYEKDLSVDTDVHIANNTIEHVCQNTSYCSAIKFFGGRFANTVVDNNILKNNLGWSYCVEQSEHVNGVAEGVFISNASGISVTNNTAVNNSYSGYIVYPRQLAATDNIFYRNRAENSIVGIDLDNALGAVDNDPKVYATRHNGTVIKENIFLNDGIGIILDPANPHNISLNNNIYTNDRLVMLYKDQKLKSIADIRKLFPFWETTGE